jgi:hypothetical protein
MRLTCAIILLAVGLVFQALLNGQTFTNGLIGLACALASVAVALSAARDRHAPSTAHVWARVVAALAILLTIIVAAGLPSAYRFQAGFNRRVKELRRQRQGADTLRPARPRSMELPTVGGGSPRARTSRVRIVKPRERLLEPRAARDNSTRDKVGSYVLAAGAPSEHGSRHSLTARPS